MLCIRILYHARQLRYGTPRHPTKCSGQDGLAELLFQKDTRIGSIMPWKPRQNSPFILYATR